MSDAALPLYATVREAGVSGLIVDLEARCPQGLELLRTDSSVVALTAHSDRETRPTVCAHPSALPFRLGSVDALVWALGEERPQLEESVLVEARRVVGSAGMLALQVPRDLSIAELDGRLRRFFPHVTTLTQHAIGGYRLQRAGVGARPETLEKCPRAEEEPPSHHLLLCSRRHRRWPESLTVWLEVAARQAAMEARVDELCSSFDAARGEVARRTQAIERLGEQQARLRAELAESLASQEEVELLLRHAESRAGKAEEHRSRASRAEARAQALEERLERLASQLHEAEETLGKVEGELHEWRTRAEQADEAHADLVESLETTRRELEEAKDHAAEAVRRCDDLSEETATQRIDVERAQAAERSAEEKARAAQATAEQASLWAREAETHLAEAQEALEMLAAKRRGWAATRATLEDELEDERTRQSLAEQTAESQVRGNREELEAELEAATKVRARFEGAQAGRLHRIAELEQDQMTFGAEVQRAHEELVQAQELAASLARELEQERRSRAAEMDNLRLHSEARIAQSWEMGERLDRATRELERLRRELDETRATRQEEAAWALVMPEQSLPPEALPEIVSVLHRGRRLRTLLSRLAAVAIAPPGEPDDDYLDL